jgi:hypothetical protein
MSSSDTTKIMDLPENITFQSNNPMMNGPPPPQLQNKPGMNHGQNTSTSYSPIDVHPNPYGHPPPSVPSMPTPSYNDSGQSNQISYPPTNSSYTNTQGQTNSYEQLQHMPQQPLPSRDIPNIPVQYTNDEQLQPNYIPPIPDSAKRTSEYVKQYDEAIERKIEAHEEVKQKQSRMDFLIEQGQIPVLVAILFFIFNMPIINTYIFKHLSFLAIYDNDGNFNLYGLLLKSIMFGSLFYSMSQGIRILSEW